MIEFQRVIIQNFMAIGSAEIRLDNQGLILIEGVNEDSGSAASNGAGKSSIVDAISWCLYGITARGDTGDAIVNAKAGSDCMVSVEVTVDGASYAITRGRKHKVLKNRLSVVEYDPTGVSHWDHTLGTDRLTQGFIERLLGCDAQTFNAAVYMGQERMPDLPAMTDKALKAILESALAIDRLDEALDIAKERVETKSAAVDRAQTHIVSLDAEIDRHEDRINEIFIDLDHAMEDAKSDIDGVKKLAADIEDALALAKSSLEAAELRVAAAGEMVEVAKADDSELVRLEMRAAQLTSSLGSIRSDMRRDEQHYRALIDGLNCECCGRPMENVTQADIDGQAKVIEAHKGDMARYEEGLRKVKALIAAERAKVNAEVLRGHSVNAEYVNARQDLSTARITLEQAEIRDTRIRSHLESVEEKWKSRLDELKKHGATAQAALKQAREALDKAKHVLPTYEAELATAQRVAHVLSRKGFRGELMDQVTPYLNARTKYYLDWLTGGEIDAVWNTITTNSDGDYIERFHIEVEAKSGVKRFSSLSGGEKRKVRLATAMALQDLVGTRAIKPIKLFVADEIDDAIDGAGLELLMSLLEEKAKDVGTMFLISHNDLADYAKQRLIVKKSGGQSTVSAP